MPLLSALALSRGSRTLNGDKNARVRADHIRSSRQIHRHKKQPSVTSRLDGRRGATEVLLLVAEHLRFQFKRRLFPAYLVAQAGLVQ